MAALSFFVLFNMVFHYGYKCPYPRPLWLLDGTPPTFGPELAYRLRAAQPTLMDVPLYFWYTILLLYIFVYHFLLPLHFGWLLVLSLYKEDYLQILNVCPFDYTAVAVSWKVERS